MIETIKALFGGKISVIITLISNLAIVVKNYQQARRDKKLINDALNEAKIKQVELDNATDYDIDIDTADGELRKRIADALKDR